MPPVTIFMNVDSTKSIPLRLFVSIQQDTHIKHEKNDSNGEDGAQDPYIEEELVIPSVENDERKAIVRINNVRSRITKLSNGELKAIVEDIRSQLNAYLLEVDLGDLQEMNRVNQEDVKDIATQDLITMFPGYRNRLIFKIDHPVYDITLITGVQEIENIRGDDMQMFNGGDSKKFVPMHNLLVCEPNLVDLSKEPKDEDGIEDIKKSIEFKYKKRQVIRVRVDLHIFGKGNK